MTNLQALLVVNDQLKLGANITSKGDEVKCWVDGEKLYLDDNDCRELAAAFTAIAASLVQGPSTETPK